MYTPTRTVASTKTMTATVTQTPTVTATFADPQKPTEAPPAPLLNAHYYYDGDGNLVKSVVNDTTTYYPSTAYQEEVSGSGTKFYKYYSG